MSAEQAAARQEAQALGWLGAMAEGSEAALTEFYRAFQARVYAFALKRLSNPAEAADVVNDTMLQVWRTADRFEGRSRVMTWVLGIANHKVMDKLRQQRRDSGEALDEALEDPNAVDACELIAHAQHGEHIRRCLGTLSGIHRQVVQLAFFEELSYPEIATVMACPEGTVKTRMFHARQGLKRCLSRLLGGAQ